VVQDAADGDARLRSMAFAFLTSLLASEHHTGSASPLYWLSSLRSRGSIAHFLTQLKSRDAILREAIHDRQLRHYDQILNYESLMSFLIKCKPNSQHDTPMIACLFICYVCLQ
jgi:hypothetical protein